MLFYTQLCRIFYTIGKILYIFFHIFCSLYFTSYCCCSNVLVQMELSSVLFGQCITCPNFCASLAFVYLYSIIKLRAFMQIHISENTTEDWNFGGKLFYVECFHNLEAFIRLKVFGWKILCTFSTLRAPRVHFFFFFTSTFPKNSRSIYYFFSHLYFLCWCYVTSFLIFRRAIASRYYYHFSHYV